MESEKEAITRKRKRSIQVLFVGFITVLILATLFSNTLQSLTLPKVRTEPLSNGSLVHKLEGSSALQPLVIKELFNPAGWEVKQIYVEEGDVVKQGQKLILYDNELAERDWQDEAAQLEKLKLNETNLQEQLIQAIAEEKNRVRNLGQEIQTRELELESLKDRFIQASRVEDKFQIRTLRSEINTCKLELEHLRSQRNTGKSEVNPAIGQLKRDIKSHKLDMDVQERKLHTFREQLDRSEEMKAPFPGRITKLNAREGLVLQGEPDLVIAQISEGFVLELTADAKLLSSLGLTPGGMVQVEAEAAGEQRKRTVQGEIAEISDTDPRTEQSGEAFAAIPRQRLKIKVIDAALKGGEQARIKLEKRSREEGLMIANSAIHREYEDLFIYKVVEQRGPLGNVFTAQKVAVQVVETDGQVTLVQSNLLYSGELVIMECSEPLQDGNRIRLQ